MMLTGKRLHAHSINGPKLMLVGNSNACQATLASSLRSMPRSSGIVTAARRTKTTTTFDGVGKPSDPEEKARVLADVTSKINARWGKGSLYQYGDIPNVPVTFLPSGCLPLDAALGGGYPKGKIIEIYGPESSGKTTLALHAIAECQKAGGTAVFIDAEHAFDMEYAQKLGVQMANLSVSQPDSGDMALDIVADLCRSYACDVIVIDSVSALVPRAEMEGEIGQTQVGGQARLMSASLRQLCTHAGKSGTTLFFINQLRYKVGVMYGNPETTSGGNALKYYASVRVDVRKKEQIKIGDEVTGFKTRAKIVKNKVAAPYREATFDIVFGVGIDSIGGLVDTAEVVGVLVRRGSHWYHGGEKLAQGRDKAIVALRENLELRSAVESATRAKLAGSPELFAGASAEDGDQDDDKDVEF